MNEVRQMLKVEFNKLGFGNIEEMITIAEYPEDMTFLQCRQDSLRDRSPTDFIDFNFAIILQKRLPPSIMYITASLHLREPDKDRVAWIAAEKTYWSDSGPFPSKEQIIREVFAAEEIGLLATVRDMRINGNGNALVGRIRG